MLPKIQDDLRCGKMLDFFRPNTKIPRPDTTKQNIRNKQGKISIPHLVSTITTLNLHVRQDTPVLH